MTNTYELEELLGFLGLIGYHNNFVVDYAQISLPLATQLKKNHFGWNEEAEVVFKEVNRAMSTIPVLALLDFSQPFIIETNASGFGLGAVFLQVAAMLARKLFCGGNELVKFEIFTGIANNSCWL